MKNGLINGLLATGCRASVAELSVDELPVFFPAFSGSDLHALPGLLDYEHSEDDGGSWKITGIRAWPVPMKNPALLSL